MNAGSMASYKAAVRNKSMANDAAHVPPAMMIETVARRRFKADFDSLDLTFAFAPGRDDRNYIITKWLDPIADHSLAVVAVEQTLAVFTLKKKEYMADYRVLRNWESAWLMLNKHPEELKDYIRLKEEMRDLHTRVKKMKPAERLQAEEDFRRYRELQGKCERLLEAQVMLERCREQKEQSQKIFTQSGKDLDVAKKREKELAQLISDDHVEADRRGMTMQACFPKVQVGFMISKINHVDTEDLNTEDIIEQMEKADRPHQVEFRRYDYMQNVISGQWESLQELRMQGKFVEDPRTLRDAFVEAGRHGDAAELSASLQKGVDVDCTDAAGASAFFAAASNGHFKAMVLLAAHGANINHRDRNMETPLLAACRRGRLDVVAWLLQGIEIGRPIDPDAPMTVDDPALASPKAAQQSTAIVSTTAQGKAPVRLPPASLDVKDRMHRTPVVHAILSGNVELVQYLVAIRTALTNRDKHWGFTPLHFAAYTGNVDVVALLLGRKASPYLESDAGWTPLRVATMNNCHEVAAMLKEFVFTEPAQNVLPGKAGTPWPANIWLGHHRAADVRWATARGFRAVVSVCKPGVWESRHAWLESEEDVLWHRVEVDCDDADDSRASWQALLAKIPGVLRFMALAASQNRELLIHDATGVSVTPAIVVLHCMVKRRMRRVEATEYVKSLRREVSLALGMVHGLTELEEELDRRKLARLEARLRDSAVFSMAF